MHGFYPPPPFSVDAPSLGEVLKEKENQTLWRKQ